MLFSTPQLGPGIQAELVELDKLRRRLGGRVGAPMLWLGQLRREAKVASARSSISIEGYDIPQADAMAIVRGAKLREAGDESRHAFACYARAMDHVGVMADDPGFRWSDRVIQDLHFDACLFQRDKSPGRWREGPIGVTGDDGAALDYSGPPGAAVPGLMLEVADWLERGDLDAHVVVRAAMAHLHVLSVHPFRDGNGRVARIVQSLVLARDGVLVHELGSIEEYLGAHTQSYYEILRQTQGGSYLPDRDATGWVEFCIDAHLDQARRKLAQTELAGARWGFLEELVEQRGWPDRLAIALEQSLFAGADRAGYAAEAEISLVTATGDLRRLLDVGLVEQRGRTRNTTYLASESLKRDVNRALSSAD